MKKLISQINPFKTLFILYPLLRRIVPGFKKLPIILQKGLAILLSITVTLTSFYGLSFLFVPKAQAAWFDDSWSYRQRVDITNSGTAQTDYQVSITLDTATLVTAGKIQSDCDDIRITDTNGKLLPHWVEESNPGCNSATTKIWTKAPSITTSGATVYLYYGNPSAANVENPTKVFVFYDNFSGDLSRWTNPSGCAGAISSGVLQITASTGCDSTPMYVTSLTQSDASGYAFDFRGKFSSGGSGRLQMYQRYRSTNTHMARLWISGTVTNSQEATPGFGGNTDIGNSGTSADTWYNFGIKVTGTSNQLYVNGTSIGTGTTVGATLTTQTDLTVGLGDYNTTVQYDNVRVRKSASTEPTIASPTNEEKAASPVAYWKFDDGTGTNAQDSTPNNLDGTVSGATWQTEDQCISGKCLYFDGTDDYVEVADNTINDLGTTWTVQFWIKPIYKTTANDYGVILSKGTAADASTDGIRFDNTDNVYVTEGGTDDLSFDISTDSPGSNWTHIALVANSSQTTLYVNGAQKTTGTTVSSSFMSKSAVMRIGDPSYDFWGSGPVPFKGYLDELKIYNQALTAAQIKAQYASKAGGNEGASAVLGATNQQNLSNGLVGYWKMDEGAWADVASEVVDSSGNALHGRGKNGATTTGGKFGNGGAFDGTNDYATIADSDTLSPTNKSLSAWVKFGALGTNDIIVYKSSEYGLSYGFTDAGCTASRFNFAFYGGGWYCANSTTAPSTGVWYHVQGTYDGTNIRLYINGALEATTTVNAPSNNATAFDIGSYSVDATTYAFNGTVDEVRLYNRALSPAEVSQLYNFAPGPVGYWNFNEKTGISANDSSGNGLTGTLTNSPTWTTGKYGGATNYSGSNMYTLVSDNTAIKPAYLVTVEAWVNPTSSGQNNKGIVGKWSGQGGDSSNSYVLLLESGIPKFYVYNGASTGQVGTTTLSANTWYHLSGTYDGANLKMYVNGVQEGTSAVTGNITTGTSPLWIGNYSGSGQTFAGSVDDVRIYNYARTAKQIVSDMNAGHPSVGSPVGSAVGHWRFDEGADNTCSGGVNDYCNSGSAGSTLDGAKNGTVNHTQSGKFGKAISPDGTTGYVSVADNASLDFGTNDFSVSSWVEFPTGGSSTWNGIVSKGFTTSAPANTWGITSGNPATDLAYQDATDAGGAWNVTLSYATASLSGWHHVVVTRSGTAYKMYDNGVLVDSDTGLSTVNLSNSSALQFANADSRYFSKDIDEIKVYNFALTADEVKLDMNQGQAQVLGSLSDNSTYQKQAANQEYCVPGDSTSCVAPVARWDLNEGTGTSAFDKSGNGYTGTITGPTYTSGKHGKGLNFDGSDDFTTLGSPTLAPDAGFTTSFWVKTTTIPDYTIPIRLEGTSSEFIFGIGKVGNSALAGRAIYFGFRGSTAMAESTTAHYLDNIINTWHHYEVTYNGGDKALTTSWNLYVDGVLITLSTQGGIGGAGNINEIGRDTAGGYLAGTMDSIRVFDYVRSAAQIAWDYNKGGPVAHWRFDECQGTTANDSSGNANSGTITVGATGTYTSMGTCPVSSASTMWYNGATGKRNYSLAFDGTDDYVSVSDPSNGSLDVGSGNWSMGAWVKTTDTNAHIISKGTTADYSYDLLTVSTDSTLRFTTYQAGGSAHCLVSLASYGGITDGSWHQVIGVWTAATSCAIYIDGVLKDTSTTISGTFNSNSAAAFEIGRRADADRPFVGQIDDTRIYNYALTATQVKTLYSEGAVNFAPSTGAP